MLFSGENVILFFKEAVETQRPEWDQPTAVLFLGSPAPPVHRSMHGAHEELIFTCREIKTQAVMCWV